MALRILLIKDNNINTDRLIEYIKGIHFEILINEIRFDSINDVIKAEQFDIIFIEYSNDLFIVESTIERIKMNLKDSIIISFSNSISASEAFTLGNLGCNGYININNEEDFAVIKKQLNLLKIRKLDNYNYENLNTILLSIADGVISTDRNGIVIYINNAAERIMGINRYEALEQNIHEIFIIEDFYNNERLKLPIEKVMETKTPIGLVNDTALKTKSQELKLLSANISPIIYSENEVNGTVIVFRDITKIKKIEHELLEERNNLINTFKNMPVGMIIINDKFEIELTNERLLKLTEYNENEIRGKGIGDILCCGNSEYIRCGSSEECGNCDLRKELIKVMKIKGNIVLYKEIESYKTKIKRIYKVSMVHISVSSTDKIVLAIEDVTEEKNMENSLIESRDFYLSLFDNFPALILRTDDKMKANYFNENWVSYTGQSYDEQVDFGWLNVFHPEEQEFLEVIKRSFEEKAELHYEHRIRRHDGIYRWVLSRATPYYNIDGEFGGYIFSSYDITEQKESAKKLVESERKYKKLFMNMYNGFLYNKIIYDENEKPINSIIIDINESLEKIFSIKKEDIVGKKLTEISLTILNYFNIEESLEQISLGETISEDINVYEDNSLWINITAYLTEKEYYAIIVTDITEKKTIEIERQESMRLATEAYKTKSEFLANMSHEIRTPLNGILGMIDLTMLTELDDEQNDNLKTAKNCADTLLKIINDILDFSKLEAGKMKVLKREFDLHSLIEKIHRMHKFKAKEKFLELNIMYDKNIPKVLVGDINKIEQVLNNLLSNAIKFTETGEITVGIKLKKKNTKTVHIVFEVVDTGIGISKADMDKLFVSFSQVDGSKTRTHGGTGLGLVISKHLLEIMGGTISVESEKGIGSKFSFSLPFELTNKNIIEKEIETIIPLSKNKSKILLVEDDRVNQMVISKQLKEMGHECIIANNGIEALEYINKADFDLCLMDIQMPILDGINTTIMIRKNQKKLNKYLPIIALTAHALRGDRERFLSIGMDDYISKPSQMQDLYNVIEKVLKKHKNINSENNDIIKEDISNKEDISEKIKQIQREMGLMEESINIKNTENIERIAHKIKGISEEIGFNDIRVLAFRVELAARRGNIMDIIELKKEVEKNFIKAVEEISNIK